MARHLLTMTSFLAVAFSTAAVRADYTPPRTVYPQLQNRALAVTQNTMGAHYDIHGWYGTKTGTYRAFNEVGGGQLGQGQVSVQANANQHAFAITELKRHYGILRGYVKDVRELKAKIAAAKAGLGELAPLPMGFNRMPMDLTHSHEPHLIALRESRAEWFDKSYRVGLMQHELDNLEMNIPASHKAIAHYRLVENIPAKRFGVQARLSP